MKRGLCIIISIVLLGGGVWLLLQLLREQGTSEWQTLPGGGDVRLLALTKGPVHRPRLPGPLITTQQIRDAIRTRSWIPLTQNRNPNVSNRSGKIDLCVWLEMQGSKSLPTPNHAKIVLTDGRAFTQLGGTSSGFQTSLFASSSFVYVPYRERTVHYVCDLEGKRFEFSATNPFYRNDLPVWKGLPLPQTKLNEDIELTLRELVVKRAEPFQRRQNTEWIATPKWSIKKGGENADSWFRIGVSFEDPSGQKVRDCGLFNEPVWKVCGNVTRRNNYPFRDDEVDWVGTVRPDAPADQTYQLLLIKVPNKRGNRFELAGVFGPGQYSIRDGAVVETQPLAKATLSNPEKVEFVFETKTVVVKLDKPSLVLIGSAFLVCRDANGRPAELDEEWGAGGFTHVELYNLPKEPKRMGTTDPGSWTFEFLIPAPAKPQINEAAAK